MKPLLNIFITATEAQAWEVCTLLDTFETKDLQRYIELALNFYEEVRVSRTPTPLSTLGGSVILDLAATHQLTKGQQMNNTASTNQENYDYAMNAMIEGLRDGKVTDQEFYLVSRSLKVMLHEVVPNDYL
jgi:hypothetical protein